MAWRRDDDDDADEEKEEKEERGEWRTQVRREKDKRDGSTRAHAFLLRDEEGISRSAGTCFQLTNLFVVRRRRRLAPGASLLTSLLFDLLSNPFRDVIQYNPT